jgi:hypothetical protein
MATVGGIVGVPPFLNAKVRTVLMPYAAVILRVVASMLLAALALSLIGFDPLRLTMLSVALTVIIMPVVVLPFLVLMNDERYVKTHTSGAIGNGVLATLTILSCLLALIVIPLEIFGG